MTKLSTQSHFNPYVIFTKTVSTINFFNKDGVVLCYKKGWFGNNKTSIPAIESLDFKLVRKAEAHYKHELPFAINAGRNLGMPIIDIYIPVCSINFELIGEEIATSLPDEICYGNFFRLEGMRFMCPTYTRIEKTESGNVCEQIDQLIKDASYSQGGIVNITKFVTETLPEINRLAKPLAK